MSLLLHFVALHNFHAAMFCVDRYVPGSPVPENFESFAEPFLNEYCLGCHSGSEPEAGLSLDTLGAMNEANATTWRSIWAQVSLREMPPEEAEQPPVSDRLQFRDWVVHNLDATMTESGFRAHRDPTKGNFVPMISYLAHSLTISRSNQHFHKHALASDSSGTYSAQ